MPRARIEISKLAPLRSPQRGSEAGSDDNYIGVADTVAWRGCRERSSPPVRSEGLEDLVPLAEDQIRSDDDGLFLVTFGEEGEEDCHFLAGLLNVADVINDGIEAVEFGERGRQYLAARR